MQQSSQSPVDQGNIKGLMLCNRPNEATAPQQITRPFVSRVFNHEKVGLNPCMDNTQFRKPQKKQNQAMMKHKQFLQQMKQDKMEAERQEQERQQRKARAIQRATAAGYQRQALERQSSCDQQLNSRTGSNGNLSSNYQNYKTSKNELLHFMDETDYNAYIKDGQVKSMLKQLQKKVGSIQQKEKKTKLPAPMTPFEQNFTQKVAHQVLQQSNHPLIRGVSQGIF